MSAGIYSNRLLQHLLELQDVALEHWRYVLITAAVVVAYFIHRDSLKDASNRFFAWIYYKYCLEGVNMALRGYRELMKEQLESQTARVSQSFGADALRILEIGMGPGANLDFFPESSQVIAVEPNPYFVRELDKLQESRTKLFRVVHGFAEDLRDVADESVDAVVSTLVMCLVSDLDKSIKEVKRVLVKMTHASETEPSHRWYINKATTQGYAIKN